jgi:hypothetical protein
LVDFGLPGILIQFLADTNQKVFQAIQAVLKSGQTLLNFRLAAHCFFSILCALVAKHDI